jgi:hypothetical protein
MPLANAEGLEETQALRVHGSANMARISASMAKSCAQKYVIAASAAGSSSQNETCTGFRTASL